MAFHYLLRMSFFAIGKLKACLLNAVSFAFFQWNCQSCCWPEFDKAKGEIWGCMNPSGLSDCDGRSDHKSLLIPFCDCFLLCFVKRQSDCLFDKMTYFLDWNCKVFSFGRGFHFNGLGMLTNWVSLSYFGSVQFSYKELRSNSIKHGLCGSATLLCQNLYLFWSMLL